MSNASNTTMHCFTAKGDPFDWKKIIARLPQFREKYSVEKGWSLVVDHKFVLDASPGLLDVAKTAIAANADLSKLGFTGDDLKAVIFTAKLINPKGVVVEQASARQVVRLHKDHECGETAAVNRLLARVGFGGEVLGEDELRDLAQQRHVVVPEAPAAATQPAQQQGESEQKTGALIETKASKKAAEKKGVSRQLRNLVTRKAEELVRLGQTIDLPEFSTDDEARTFLANLEKQHDAIKAEGAGQVH